jgi:uncharacterized PurR-regulated membrane protein YhhQ (DUF165 family)
MLNLRPLLLSLVLWSGSVPAGTLATLTFTPANPTTADSIIATLGMATCGGTTTSVVAATQITITTVETACGTPPPFTTTTLGPLAAGTYLVQWLVAPSQTPVATATLVVAAAVTIAPAPALQPWGIVLLAFAFAAGAARSLRYLVGKR